jgi:hypothetical protein
MLDPESVLRLANDHQARLLREAEAERMLASLSGRAAACSRLVCGLLLRAGALGGSGCASALARRL